MLPECNQWKPAVQPAAVMLRKRPVDGQPATPTSHIRRAILRMAPPAARADPAQRLHYVVISWDGRKLVTRVRVMLPQQRNRAPIANLPKGAQLGGSLYHAAKSHLGPCSSVDMRRLPSLSPGYYYTQTHRHTDRHRLAGPCCVIYDSRKM